MKTKKVSDLLILLFFLTIMYFVGIVCMMIFLGPAVYMIIYFFRGDDISELTHIVISISYIIEAVIDAVKAAVFFGGITAIISWIFMKPSHSEIYFSENEDWFAKLINTLFFGKRNGQNSFIEL